MSTHEHTPDELVHALRLIRSECRSHPEDCTECPLSFSDGGPIRQCGIVDQFLPPEEWKISPELVHALQVIRSECRSHPEDCTECPLSFSDGGPIRRCGIIDRPFTPAEWDISPTQRWQAFADETRRADP